MIRVRMAETGGRAKKQPLRELRKAEVRSQLARAMGDLYIKLGRLPTVDELAAHSGVPKRTTYRYEAALFAGLPPEFLEGLRSLLPGRPKEETNREALVRALLQLVQTLAGGQVQFTRDRAAVSAYVPETAVIRFESWQAVWRPVLLADLAERREELPAAGSPYDDDATVHRLFAALELALGAWHDAGGDGHPGEFLRRAVCAVFPELPEPTA